MNNILRSTLLKLCVFYMVVISILFIFPEVVKAQSTITVASGTTNSITYGPLYTTGTALARSSRHAYIYPQGLLTGLANGDFITSIEFNRATATGSLTPGGNYKIYLKNYNDNTWGAGTLSFATAITGATLVYDSDPASNIGSDAGWKSFAFSNPYVFNTATGPHLVILVEYSKPAGTGTTSTINWYYDNTAQFPDFVAHSIKYNNNTTSDILNDALASTNSIHPQLKINYMAAVACTAPPTAGTINTSKTWVCSGETYSMSLVGNSFGTGQTYQWQESADNVSWTDIPAANGTSYSTSQTVNTKYYRAIAACSGQSDTSNAIVVNAFTAALAGSYTIDKNSPASFTNFSSFADANYALGCAGVSGPVTFSVSSDVYTEQVVINTIAGASESNPVRFVGNSSTVRFAPNTSANPHVFRLSDVDYVILDSLTIEVDNSSTYGWALNLLSGSSNNIVRNCTIKTRIDTTASAFHGVLLNGSVSTYSTGGTGFSNNLFEDNTIVGGYYGITFYGSSAGFASNKANVFKKNTVRDAYMYQMYLSYADSTQISENDLYRQDRTNGSAFAGVFTSTSAKRTIIEKNKIHDPFGSSTSATAAAYGMYISGTDSDSPDDFIVRNNVIYNMNGTTGARYALYNSSSDNTSFYNNTIIMDDPNPSAGVIYGFYQTTAATGIKLYNNIFYINSPGSGARIGQYWNTAGVTVNSDYNAFYISSAGSGNNAVAHYGGTSGTTYAALTDWQLFGNDINGVETDPLLGPGLTGNHVPGAAALNNSALSLTEVTDDITGVLRSATPDIGAYEFNPPTEDVSMNAVNLPKVCVGSQDVSVLITNAGLNPLSSVDINWTLNGVLQTPFTYLGFAMPGESFDVTIGQFNVIKDTAYSIVAWSSNPNNLPDFNQLNDTARSLTLQSGLAGNYTVGGVGADYADVSLAAAALSARGVCDAVVFDINPLSGPYIGQVLISNVSGTDSSNTIRFKGNGATVEASPNNTNERYIIRIESSDYITIDSLNIVGNDTATYGWGIHIMAGSDYNTIRNNTITLNKTATTLNYAGIILNGSNTAITPGTTGAYNLIENNIINGGNYGIAITGLANNEASVYNRIINNEIKDAYLHGIYVNAADSTLVSGNDISRPTRTGFGAGGAGVIILGGAKSVIVEKNRIHDTHTANSSVTTAAYGIQLSSSDAVASRPVIVRNNLIYNINTNGIIYGLYSVSSDHVLWYNNTVYISDINSIATVAGYAFYESSLGEGQEVKNNILYMNRAGTGPRRAISLATGSTIVSDNNDLFVSNISTGTGTTNTPAVAYMGSLYATLADWQLASNKDQNSQSVDPLCMAPAIGELTPGAVAINDAGVSLVLVPDDFFGIIRGSSPDIGAIEFAPVTEDAGLTSIDSPLMFCPGVQAVKVTLNNFGVNSLGNVTINWELNGIAQSPFNYSGNLFSGEDTSIVIGTFNAQANVNYTIKAWTTNPNGLTDLVNANDTVQKSNIRTSFAGVYTIGGTTADFQSISEAVNLLSTYGICDSVRFEVDSSAGPYNEQILLSNISGLDSTRPLVFNGNGAIITQASSVTADRYVFRLVAVDYVTINGFNIVNSAGTYGWGVHLFTGSNNNTISNNTIIVSPSSTTSGNHAGIIISGSNTGATTAGLFMNNKIINNVIDGGFYGIVVSGTTTNHAGTSGHLISRNTIKNSYNYGIYVLNQHNVTIEENDISRPTRTSSTTMHGIYASAVTSGLRIVNNRIHNLFDLMPTSTSASYPIYLANADHTLQNRGLVANNVIYAINGGGLCYGIYNSSSDSISYLHNSISLNDQISGKTQATYGFYQTTEASGLEYYNNSISITRNTTGNRIGMYFATAATIPVSDYNLFYTPSGFAGYHGSNRTLAQWQTLHSNDLNSIDADPLYNGRYNLVPRGGSPLVNSGIAVPQVTEDIDGNTRDLLSPYIGAYETTGDFSGPRFQVINPIKNTTSIANYLVGGVVDITDQAGVDVSPANRPRIYYKYTSNANNFVDNTDTTNGWKYTEALNATSPFSFEIDYSKLYGSAIATDSIIEYFFVAQDSIGYVSNSHGIFTEDPITIMQLGSTNFPLNGDLLSYRISAIISQDTFLVGTGQQFPNLTSNDGLFKYLNDRAISNDITVIIKSSLGENGANALNQLVEVGQGNYTVRIKNDTNIVRIIQGSYAGGLIRLNGADRVIIDGSHRDSGRYFQIRNTSTASNIATIQLIGLGSDTSGATDNIIKNCVLSTGATSGNSIVVKLGGAGFPYERVAGNHRNKILNNLIYQGSVGIANMGNTGGNTSNGTVIAGNIIGADDGSTTENLRLYGLALDYNSHTLIENNLIQNIRNTGAQQSWGIQCLNGFDSGMVVNNVIRNVVGGGGGGAMGGRGLEVRAGNGVVVTNNMISGISGPGSDNLSSTSNVGIYVSAPGVSLYNNSVHLSGTVSRTTTTPDKSAAIYVSATSNNLNVLNNTFSNIQENVMSTTDAYAIYSEAANTAYLNFDYNNYYVGSSDNNPQGILARILGTDINSIADLQQATLKNGSSINLNPGFISDLDLHAEGSALYQKGQAIPGITHDIDGELRNDPPCIGADEFTAPENDIVNTGILYPLANSAVCGVSSDSIRVIIYNLGTVAQTGFNVTAYISGAISDTLTTIYTGTLAASQRDTVTLRYFNSTADTGVIAIQTIVNLIGDVANDNDTSYTEATLFVYPVAPVAQVASVACMGEEAVLAASHNDPNVTIKWYDQIDAGTPVHTGDTLKIPSLATAGTYYAEATTSTIQVRNTGLPAKLNPTSGAGLANYGIVFDVLSPFTLESVVVYPVAANEGTSGTVTIDVIDGNGAVLHSRIVNVIGAPIANSTPQRVILNFDMVPGNNYKIMPRARSGGISGLAFEPSASAPGGNYGYPFVVPGILNIRTSTLSAPPTNTANNSLYYYFYDWHVKTGRNGCASERVPVSITPAPLPSGATVAQSSPFNGSFNAGTLINPDEACLADTLTYEITPPTGFNAVDIGVTWTVLNPQVLTLGGAVPAGSINMSGSSLQYIAASGDVDSALVFTATVQNIATGCDSGIIRYLHINSIPGLDLGADRTVCVGTTVVLDAGTSGVKYVWSTGDTTQTIQVTDAGSYWVELSNASGCSVYDTIVINTISLPTQNLGEDIFVCAGTVVTLDAGNAGAGYEWSTGDTTQTIQVLNTGGTFVVTVTIEGGCTMSDTISVTFYDLPVVNLGIDRSICVNDIITLNAGNAGATYLWSTGETTQTIQVNAAGIYSVTVTSTEGCVSTDTVEIDHKTTPNAAFTYTADGPALTFTASSVVAGQLYAWDFGDPASGGANTSALPNPTHNFTDTVEFTVTLTITNVATGCVSTTSQVIKVSPKIVSVENENTSSFALVAKPNPFMERTTIAYHLPQASDVSVEVYDMLGRKVSTVLNNEHQSAGNHELEYRNADEQSSNGMYMIRLIVNGQGAMIRVIDLSKK